MIHFIDRWNIENTCTKQILLKDAKNIIQTENVQMLVRKSFDTNVVVFNEFSDFSKCYKTLLKDIRFNKIIGNEMLCDILKHVEMFMENSKNSLDTIIIKYDAMPVLCCINSSNIQEETQEGVKKMKKHSVVLDVNRRYPKSSYVPYILGAAVLSLWFIKNLY